MHLRRKISLFTLGKLFTGLNFKGLRQGSKFGILLQRGIVIFDCEAAALPGRFLPELGRSHERPFFLPSPLLLACAELSPMNVMSTSPPPQLARAQNPRSKTERCKILAQKLRFIF
jgi:hypothetical protein